MKIAVIGTHGIGKTTFITQLYTYCVQIGSNVRLIHEVARDCPLGINECFSQESATWIMTTQIARELEAKARGADVVLCDRSAIDPIMYLHAKFGHNHDDTSFCMSELAYAWLATYDVLIYLRPCQKPIIADGVRDTDTKFQIKVDEEFQVSIASLIDAYPHKTIFTISSDSIYNTDQHLFFKNLLESSYD